MQIILDAFFPCYLSRLYLVCNILINFTIIYIVKLMYTSAKDSSLCEGMEEGNSMKLSSCMLKEVVYRFEPMTNWSPRYNFTVVLALGLLICTTDPKYLKQKHLVCLKSSSLMLITFLDFSIKIV